jgi:hypothetical protein
MCIKLLGNGDYPLPLSPYVTQVLWWNTLLKYNLVYANKILI